MHTIQFSYMLPVVFGCVLEQLPQLQRVFTDLLDRREQETSDGDVNHLLEEAAGLKEMFIFAHLHETLQLSTGSRMSVAILGVDRKSLALQGSRETVQDD